MTSKRAAGQDTRGGYHKLPYAFTEQGIALLSGILRSDVAIAVSIRLMNTFVEMCRALSTMAPMMTRLEAVERRQITDQSRNEERFDQIFAKMSEGEVPLAQIFYQGRFWDVKSLLIKFIRRAKNELIVTDAYVDVPTLDMLAKRGNVDVIKKLNKIGSQVYSPQMQLLPIVADDLNAAIASAFAAQAQNCEEHKGKHHIVTGFLK